MGLRRFLLQLAASISVSLVLISVSAAQAPTHVPAVKGDNRAATSVASPPPVFTTLVSFGATNGSSPYAALVQASDGDLYGSTIEANGGADGFGNIFTLSPHRQLTDLIDFNGTNGTGPFVALLQSSTGALYGTTLGGGLYDGGEVFRISQGVLDVVYNFNFTNSADGSIPGGLVEATDGNFYGTTYTGGANTGGGTVFRITPAGNLTTMYSFCSQVNQTNCLDGAFPGTTPIQGTDGNFYGTTQYGGTSTSCNAGCGTVFKVTPGGTLTTLHSFDSTDGGYPYAKLVQGTDGNFYGTTSRGGVCVLTEGCGTVFKISPQGALTTLHTFCAQMNCPDGLGPTSELIQATDGNFYGTTGGGGTYGQGAIFEITPAGAFTTLYSFCVQAGCPDGKYPYAALVQDTNGSFYGTTLLGGKAYCIGGCGVVYRLNVELAPFVETQTPAGKVGASVVILGTNLAGASNVTFNGIAAAAFTFISDSAIRATVPTGATTGPVVVITPGGVLTSNKNFRVLR